MATHSSTLAWKIPWMEEPGGLQFMESQSVGHDWAPSLSLFTFMHSVQFNHSVVSDSLRPHGSQHARPPVHHHLPEFTQTHVHRVGEDIQPSHPLSSAFPPAPNPSQHQSLFQWVNSSHEVAKVLEFHALEKEMATHSSILAWRIPGTEEPGGLPSMGSHRVRHDWSDLAYHSILSIVSGW